MSHTSIIDELPLIDVPVLNIIGAHDAIVPPSHQIHLSGRLPRVHTVILNKVGHLPMAEARDKVDQLIGTFLLFGPLTANRKNILTNPTEPKPFVNALPLGL
jgi:pimeloyl-ACP methyl ester carboxylesterase